ncbi:MAG: hypothetical protein AB1644_12250 [Candidatus Zixiibacteriota bacterium]
MNVSTRAVAVFWLLLALCLLPLTCSDHGTDPPPEPVDYVAYITDEFDTRHVYGYHVESGLIDTIWTGADARWGIYVSPDGKRLYLASDAGVSVFDLGLDMVVHTIESHGTRGAALSPDGQFLAVCASDFQIVRTVDFSVAYSDTFELSAGSFTDDGRAFFGASGSVSGVYCVSFDGEDTVIAAVPTAAGLLKEVTRSCGDSLFYLNLTTGSFSSQLIALDPDTDSALYVEDVVPGHGDLQMTPTGDMLFYTSPGTALFGPPTPRAFFVLDVPNLTRVATVSTTGLINQNGDTVRYFNPSSLAITPDGRRLVVISGLTNAHFLVFDVATMKIERVISILDIPTPMLRDVALPRHSQSSWRKQCVRCVN